jgi:hemolysin-activating ACP:hemolysin acyltransferase
MPSINLNQYKIFEDSKGIYGFVNWARLNNIDEEYYTKTGSLNKNQWNSGKKLWLYDIVILRKAKEVMRWVYNYFKGYLRTNESINWLRLDKQNNIYRIGKKYKREFHN